VMSNWRFATIALMLAATAIFLRTRNRTENLPDRQPIASFPVQLGNWSGTDVEIPQNVHDVLGAGDFLLRVYHDPLIDQPPVDLFLAYFPSQRTGDTIHSPKNCLPGAGWSPVESSRITLSSSGHDFPANRYVIAKGPDRELVIYWYWAHNRGLASEYWAKLYLVADAIRLNRSDGSLVRVTTPLARGETTLAAEQRLVAFAENVVPLLNQYVPP
jgi:EpsI family protein